MADEGKFQDRISTGSGKLVVDDTPIINRQALTGLTTEGAFDLDKLDIQMNADLDLLGAAESVKPQTEDGLKIDTDLNKLDEGIRRIQAQQANQKVRQLLGQAQAEMERKNYKQAIKLLDQALAIEPHSGELHFMKGYAWMSMGEFEKALESLYEARNYAGGETLLFVMVLQAICMRGITESIAKKVNELVQKGQLPEALRLVDNALMQQPRNPALMYHRGGILMLMERLREAEGYVSNAIRMVGAQNAGMLTELLDTIHFRQHEGELEAARQALRRGAPSDAVRVLERFRSELEGIGKYDAVFEYACERAGGKGLMSVFRKRGKPLTEQNRQQTLQWLLREELGAAVMLIGNNQFAQARKFLLQAYRLDQRCSLVNFLAALSTLRAFDAALEAKQQVDFQQELQNLSDASTLAGLAMSDPQMRQPAFDLRKTLDRYVEQMREVERQASRAKQEAKPINDLLNDFNNTMEGIQKHGIGSQRDIDNYEKKFKSMRDTAEKLRRGRSADQGGELLGKLIRSIDDNLGQLGQVRKQAGASEMLGVCYKEFNDVMSYYQRKPISNYNQAQEARNKINAIYSKLQAVKSAGLGGEAGRAVQQLEEALLSVLRQLNG